MAASEGASLGGAGAPAVEPAGSFVEPPEVRRQRGPRALAVAARLLAGAATFFFLAFLFAYFYLRSVNIDHMWRPAHINPDKAMGVVFIVCIVLSVVLAIVADRQQRADSSAWVGAAAGAVLFGIIAVVAQCIGYTSQNFGPTNGAFASVFCSWTAFYLIAVLGAMYWLETQVATELRERRKPAEHQIDPATGYENPDELLPRGLDAAVFFWAYLGALGVVMYVTLYLL